MDETTLNALVRGPEGERVERKERLTASKDDICKAICAFANDLPRSGEPGVVIIGQADKGKPVGLPITDRLLRELADLRTNGGILSFPQTSVRPFEVDGVLVAIIIVEPSSDPPVRYNGRTWIRVGPTTRQATAQEEVILTERRQAANLPYDARALQSATLEDLDIVRFDEGLLSQFVAEEQPPTFWHSS
jgi:ATP-dependent DNA helicase RecG